MVHMQNLFKNKRPPKLMLRKVMQMKMRPTQMLKKKRMLKLEMLMLLNLP